MILELESWRQGCHRGCLINMNAWILRRNQTFSDRKWIHLIWLPAFLRLLFSNSCESTSPRFWRKYIKPIYNIQQARKYIICNYFNIMLKKKVKCVKQHTVFNILWAYTEDQSPRPPQLWYTHMMGEYETHGKELSMPRPSGWTMEGLGL